MSYKFCFLLSLLCLHQAESCPDEAGWIAVGNSSCYLASLDNFGWEYAQQVCKQEKKYFMEDIFENQFCWDQGGYLAEITSAEEESALDEILGHITTYWIGLSDRETEGGEDTIYHNIKHHLFLGSYIWSESGQEADYTNWAEGQPDDDHAPAEDCIFKIY